MKKEKNYDDIVVLIYQYIEGGFGNAKSKV